MCSGDPLVERAARVASAAGAEARLLRLAELRQAVDTAMVAALAEVEDAPGMVLLDGSVDGGRWLASRSEIHPAETTALVRLAGDLPTMPATAEALQNGRIGTEKARLLRSVREIDAFAAAEAGLVEQIVGVSWRAARRVIGRFRADHRDDGQAEVAPSLVTLTLKRNGRWHLIGDLDEPTGQLLATELRRLADAHRDDEGLNMPRRYALGLLDMARRSVTLGERGPGSRPELVLVADVSFDGEVINRRYEDGTPVTRKVFENLSCDATVRGLLMNGPSDPLDLGRSQRLATTGQRRAATIRDGGCVYPGCDRPPDSCELHHIRHWLKHQGRTDISNLCLMCRRHHALTHSMGFTFVRHRRGSLTIYRPDGTPLTWPGEKAA